MSNDVLGPGAMPMVTGDVFEVTVLPYWSRMAKVTAGLIAAPASARLKPACPPFEQPEPAEVTRSRPRTDVDYVVGCGRVGGCPVERATRPGSLRELVVAALGPVLRPDRGPGITDEPARDVWFQAAFAFFRHRPCPIRPRAPSVSSTKELGSGVL